MQQRSSLSKKPCDASIDVGPVVKLGCCLQAFKLSSSLIIQEYLQTGDTDEAARSLEELQQPSHHSCFVKQVLPSPR